ncbi:MAG: TetR/AcrR family transcriptional regulator, partial [Stackebrandtia sp.]
MKSNTSPPSRRELQRAGTVADIKAAARVRLVESGPSGISLRAVARDLRVSAPALYRYFPSLDALVTALCVDFYDELIGYMWERCEALPETDVVGRLLAATRSFRV